MDGALPAPSSLKVTPTAIYGAVVQTKD